MQAKNQLVSAVIVYLVFLRRSAKRRLNLKAARRDMRTVARLCKKCFFCELFFTTADVVVVVVVVAVVV